MVSQTCLLSVVVYVFAATHKGNDLLLSLEILPFNLVPLSYTCPYVYFSAYCAKIEHSEFESCDHNVSESEAIEGGIFFFFFKKVLFFEVPNPFLSSK